MELTSNVQIVYKNTSRDKQVAVNPMREQKLKSVKPQDTERVTESISAGCSKLSSILIESSIDTCHEVSIH